MDVDIDTGPYSLASSGFMISVRVSSSCWPCVSAVLLSIQECLYRWTQRVTSAMLTFTCWSNDLGGGVGWLFLTEMCSSQEYLSSVHCKMCVSVCVWAFWLKTLFRIAYWVVLSIALLLQGRLLGIRLSYLTSSVVSILYSFLHISSDFSSWPSILLAKMVF